MIWKTCYVYVDDVIVFSATEKDHIYQVGQALKSLYGANMRVFNQKSEFFTESVEFLGLVSTLEGPKTSPNEVKALEISSNQLLLFTTQSALSKTLLQSDPFNKSVNGRGWKSQQIPFEKYSRIS